MNTFQFEIITEENETVFPTIQATDPEAAVAEIRSQYENCDIISLYVSEYA